MQGRVAARKGEELVGGAGTGGEVEWGCGVGVRDELKATQVDLRGWGCGWQ